MKLELPPEFNYVAAFISPPHACNLQCPYCIARDERYHKIETLLSAQDWITALSRIPSSNALPVTLCGGEPTKHPEFYKIVRWADCKFDLLTNGTFDSKEFVKNVPVEKFRTDLGKDVPSWFSSIRISLHLGRFGYRDIDEYHDRLTSNVVLLRDAGFKAGIVTVNHPDYQDEIAMFGELMEQVGVPFQVRPILGIFGGKLYGEYKYPEGVTGGHRKCECRTRELLIACDGGVYKCHHDLYRGTQRSIGNILSDSFQPTYRFRECGSYGSCNFCDVKATWNRFGDQDYCSVDIRNIQGELKMDEFDSAAMSTCPGTVAIKT